MFTGHSVRDLPEARKGFPGWDYVDKWPFIFKDMKMKNYTTVLSDDDPGLGAWSFRLSGFNKQPTGEKIYRHKNPQNQKYQTDTAPHS